MGSFKSPRSSLCITYSRHRLYRSVPGSAGLGTDHHPACHEQARLAPTPTRDLTHTSVTNDRLEPTNRPTQTLHHQHCIKSEGPSNLGYPNSILSGGQMPGSESPIGLGPTAKRIRVPLARPWHPNTLTAPDLGIPYVHRWSAQTHKTNAT